MDASELDLTDYDSIIEEGIRAYSPLFQSIARVVADLLHQCGARMPPLVDYESDLL
jgi:hypothetical protein